MRSVELLIPPVPQPQRSGGAYEALTAWRRVQKYSDLVTSVAILAFNTAVVAAKMFECLPRFIDYSARAGLSYVGFGSAPWMVRNIEKQELNFTEAWQARDLAGVTAMAASTLNQSTSLLLMGGGAVACVLGLVGQGALAMTMYVRMAPIGLAGLVASIALDVFRYVDGKILFSKLSANQRTPLAQICSADSAEARRLPSSFLKLRAQVARNLDLDSWYQLKRGSASSIQAWTSVATHCRKQLTYQRNELINRAFGYYAMAMCKLFPETLVEKMLLWICCATYTSNLAYRKLFERQTQSSLSL